MEKVEIDIGLIMNYMIVGFRVDNGHQDGAINVPRSLCYPKIRACLTMDLVILLGLVFSLGSV